MNKNSKFDVIIVGCGISGLLCAYEIARSNIGNYKKILLIDKGLPSDKRFCPVVGTEQKCVNCSNVCNKYCGFGGETCMGNQRLGLYHLSRFYDNYPVSQSPFGSEILKKLSLDELKKLVNYVDGIFVSFGADPEVHGIKNREKIVELIESTKALDISFVDVPYRNIFTNDSKKILSGLEQTLNENNVDIMYSSEVVDIISERGKAVGVRITSVNDITNSTIDIYGKNIVIATGSKTPHWISALCKKYNIKKERGSLETGIRYELDKNIVEDLNKTIGKYRLYTTIGPFQDVVKICDQQDMVVKERGNEDFSVASGISSSTPLPTTNFAVMIRHYVESDKEEQLDIGRNYAQLLNKISDDEIAVQKLGNVFNGTIMTDKEFKNNPIKPSLPTAKPNDVAVGISFRNLLGVLGMCEKINKIIPGFYDDNNLIYAPAMVVHPDIIEINNNFESSIKNLYFIGECSGLTGELMFDAVSGVKLGRHIVEKNK